MLDLSWFRANLDAAADRLATRGFELDREEFRANMIIPPLPE